MKRTNTCNELTLADKGMPISDIAEIVKVSSKVVAEWLSGRVNVAK